MYTSKGVNCPARASFVAISYQRLSVQPSSRKSTALCQRRPYLLPYFAFLWCLFPRIMLSRARAPSACQALADGAELAVDMRLDGRFPTTVSPLPPCSAIPYERRTNPRHYPPFPRHWRPLVSRELAVTPTPLDTRKRSTVTSSWLLQESSPGVSLICWGVPYVELVLI